MQLTIWVLNKILQLYRSKCSFTLSIVHFSVKFYFATKNVLIYIKQLLYTTHKTKIANKTTQFSAFLWSWPHPQHQLTQR
jgi:hypothetical protein